MDTCLDDNCLANVVCWLCYGALCMLFRFVCHGVVCVRHTVVFCWKRCIPTVWMDAWMWSRARASCARVRFACVRVLAAHAWRHRLMLCGLHGRVRAQRQHVCCSPEFSWLCFLLFLLSRLVMVHFVSSTRERGSALYDVTKRYLMALCCYVCFVSGEPCVCFLSVCSTSLQAMRLCSRAAVLSVMAPLPPVLVRETSGNGRILPRLSAVALCPLAFFSPSARYAVANFAKPRSSSYCPVPDFEYCCPR